MQEPPWAATRAPTVSSANLLPVQKLWGKSWALGLTQAVCVYVEGWVVGEGGRLWRIQKKPREVKT